MTNQKVFLTSLLKNNQDAIIVGSIGSISTDLNDIPHPSKVLIRGAMGAAMACGFGIALGKPDQKVIVVVGDGSVLMCLGHISTILAWNLANLKVIVLDNGCYNSCGGQETNFKEVRDYLENLNMFEVHEVLP